MTNASLLKLQLSEALVLLDTVVRDLEVEQQFRRINGYRDLHVLKRALQQKEEVIASTRRIA